MSWVCMMQREITTGERISQGKQGRCTWTGRETDSCHRGRTINITHLYSLGWRSQIAYIHKKKAQENQSKMAETPVPSLYFIALGVNGHHYARGDHVQYRSHLFCGGSRRVCCCGGGAHVLSHGTYPGCRLYLGDGCGQRDRKGSSGSRIKGRQSRLWRRRLWVVWCQG